MFTKVFNDPIHGHMPFSADCLRVMDQPLFQRMRGIKQLGSTSYVFLGATHTRFDHSCGTGYLARKWAQRFQRNQPELDITNRDLELVQLAGLGHDLGHGPFSHAFENNFLSRAAPERRWSHEEQSQEVFEACVDNAGLEITTDEIAFVRDAIGGTVRKPDRAFLYQLVNNTTNSIDVDKFDYMTRDTHHLGLKSVFDYKRIVDLSKVLDNQICFHTKVGFSIYDLFSHRFTLYREIYSHSVAIAIDYMVTDALLAAEPVLNLVSATDDLGLWSSLTDSILDEIRRGARLGNEDLRAADQILDRLARRDLYKLADEVLIQSHEADMMRGVMTPEALSKTSDGVLSEGELIVHTQKLSYGMKRGQNPIDCCRFFSTWDAETSVPLHSDKFSFLMPQLYEERVVQLFLRDPTPQKIEAAQLSFQSLLARTLPNKSPHQSLKRKHLQFSQPGFISPSQPGFNSSPQVSSRESQCAQVVQEWVPQEPPAMVSFVPDASPLPRKRKNLNVTIKAPSAQRSPIRLD